MATLPKPPSANIELTSPWFAGVRNGPVGLWQQLQTMIPGDSKCWRRLRWGICTSAVDCKSTHQSACSSSEHHLRFVTPFQSLISIQSLAETILLSEDTQCLAAEASIGSHITKPKYKAWAYSFQIRECVDNGERSCVSLVPISKASDIELRVK